ncbi:izumo sperm-egg fusion protein 1 isoform 2-T2 [Sarcophilus harrisii]
MRPEEPRWGSPGAGLSFSRRGSLLHSALPLGLVVLGLALSSRRAWGCVLCDPAVVAGLRDLEQEYLPSHLDVDPKVLQIFVSRLEETVRQFIDLPFNPASYQGLIDEPTLSKVSWDFLKELKRIRDSNLKDSFLLKELTWTLHMQKENFARMAAEFQRESFCPNKCGERAALPSQASPRAPAKASTCRELGTPPGRPLPDTLGQPAPALTVPAPAGLMMQTLIWCFGCEKRVHTCFKSFDCGEQYVRVPKNGDMVLDCELSWHKAAEGLTYYHFYRVWPNHSEVLISRGRDPALTKPMVSLEDAGDYRCILGTVRRRNPATVITYHVAVDPESASEELSPLTSTSVPKKTLATTIKLPAAYEPGFGPETDSEAGSEGDLGPCTGEGDIFVDSGRNAARILNITLIGLVAGGAAAVLGSLALTLYCARKAGLNLVGKQSQGKSNSQHSGMDPSAPASASSVQPLPVSQ